MAVWVVRGGSWRDDAEQDFLESESVGIYFLVDRDLNEVNDSDLRLEIERNYILDRKGRNALVEGSRVRGVVSYYLNQVLKFRDGIKLDDVTIMPRKASSGHTVAQGVVEGGYEYWGDAAYRHRRRVRWTETEVPRESIGHMWHPSDQRMVFRIDE